MRKSISKSILNTAKDLDKAGFMGKKTMHTIQELCVSEVANYTPKDIAALRERNNLSQGVMAELFNVSKSTIAQWEQGHKKPRGASRKILSILDKRGIDVFL